MEKIALLLVTLSHWVWLWHGVRSEKQCTLKKKKSLRCDLLTLGIYCCTSDLLHWFRATFTCESKMTKADIDLVLQSPRQVHILSLTELQLTGPYVEFKCTGSSSIVLEIRMHECFFKSLYKWSSEKGTSDIQPCLFESLCWWVGAVWACFSATIPSCGGYFLRLVCSRIFCLHG